MELERIQNTGLALGAAPQTQSATSSSFGMCCIRPGKVIKERPRDRRAFQKKYHKPAGTNRLPGGGSRG